VLVFSIQTSPNTMRRSWDNPHRVALCCFAKAVWHSRSRWWCDTV